MTDAQLIRQIEQQLENLMALDEDLSYEYECNLYDADDMDKPIEELFTLELLKELEHVVYELDFN